MTHDNHQPEWPDYGTSGTPQGNQINVIAEDSPPHVLRNVALYYEAKDEPWAIAMGGRLRSAARTAERLSVVGNNNSQTRRAA